MVSLALAPSYRLRKSRWCKTFVIAVQPIVIFDSLFSTPEKEVVACESVWGLSDAFDDVQYSQDVVMGTAGETSMSNFFFIDDGNERLGCPYRRLGVDSS